MANEHPETIGELFSDVVGQTTHLFRTELRLAKSELGEKVSQAMQATGFILAGLVLLMGAFYMFLAWIVRMLVLFGVPDHWATLLVAVVVFVIGFVVVRMGMSRLQPSRFVPDRTMRSVGEDAAIVRETAR
jgi:uncharacterized membrane protein YqjE